MFADTNDTSVPRMVYTSMDLETTVFFYVTLVSACVFAIIAVVVCIKWIYKRRNEHSDKSNRHHMTVSVV